MKKKYAWLTVTLFLIVLFGFSIAFLLLPDRSFSEQENRSLQTRPVLTAGRLFSGAYASEINDYYADQFPLRNELVGWKGMTEIALGKGENDGILLSKNGSLARRKWKVRMADGNIIPDADAFDPVTIREACNGLNRVAETLNCPFSVLLTGRNIDVETSDFDYPADFSNALLQEVRNRLNDSVSNVETVPLFREKTLAGERMYYRTDHHWTSQGAYLAYQAVMRSFGMEQEIIPEKAFEKQVVSDSFYGTLWSAGGMKWVAPDRVELWLYGNEDQFEVIADGKELEGLYSMHWLKKKDHYSVFLDGTHDVVTVRMRTGEPRPTLLLLKDSFANSLAPFLAQHFDLILLNLSSQKSDFTDLSHEAETRGADAVLLVYTLENVITTNKLSRLK